MLSWALKELMDRASTTFRGRLFQSLIVFGKNEYKYKVVLIFECVECVDEIL